MSTLEEALARVIQAGTSSLTASLNRIADALIAQSGGVVTKAEQPQGGVENPSPWQHVPSAKERAAAEKAAKAAEKAAKDAAEQEAKAKAAAEAAAAANARASTPDPFDSMFSPPAPAAGEVVMTLDQVKEACGKLYEAAADKNGFQNNFVKVINTMGCQSLKDVPADKYPELLAALK